jgi:hypothetical protein
MARGWSGGSGISDLRIDQEHLFKLVAGEAGKSASTERFVIDI